MEILITGDKIYYRHIVDGQTKPPFTVAGGSVTPDSINEALELFSPAEAASGAQKIALLGKQSLAIEKLKELFAVDFASVGDLSLLSRSFNDHSLDDDIHVTADKQAAWNSMIPLSQKAAAGGVASLDESGNLVQSVSVTKLTGVIDSSNLPGYVDDVVNVEYWQEAQPTAQDSEVWYQPSTATLSAFNNNQWFVVDIEHGKIYIATQTNASFRWSGTTMISLSNPLDYATDEEMQAGTNNTKVVTALRWIRAFAYHCANYVFSSLGGRTIIAAINSKLETIKINGVAQTVTNNAVDLLINSLENNITTVTGGSIVLNKNSSVYSMYVIADTTVTLDNSGVNTANFIRFYLRINQTGYNTVTFPQNWIVYGSIYPSEIGEYIYEVTRGYNGDWNVRVIMRKVESLAGTINESEGTVVNNHIYYVDGLAGSDSNSGLSWSTAFLTVQKAIDTAVTSDSVFVKGSLAGITYLPTTLLTADNAKSASFVMKSGVNVYGGFSGTESTIFEREMLNYQYTLKNPKGDQIINCLIPKCKSILSGELAGAQTLGNASYGCRYTTAQMANNAYAVVYADLSQTTILNGFEIAGGYCPSTNTISGAAITSFNSPLRVLNCRIHDNYSANSSAGGSITYGAIMSNCIVEFNSWMGSSSILSNNSVIISSYISQIAILNNNSTNGQYASTLVNCNTIDLCYISGNYYKLSTTSIGPTYTYSCIKGNIYNTYIYNNTCIIVSNAPNYLTALWGTASAGASLMYNTSISMNTITGAPVMGICSSNAASNMTIVNSMIDRNTADSIILNNASGTLSKIMVYNSIFRNNRSSNATNSSVIVACTAINCTVISNQGIVNSGYYNCAVRNSIAYANRIQSGAVNNYNASTSGVAQYSAFENEIITGTGNISLSVNNTGDANSPVFKYVSTSAGVVDDGYQSNAEILAGSCLINAGLDSLNTETTAGSYDFHYKPRKVGTIDIGAYEYQG